jgi:anaerobic ribonucleoside-triphosphate reductase
MDKYPGEIIDEIILEFDSEGYVNIETHKHANPFVRIRRITGYLVGTLDRFNDGKRAEEADRVKHTVTE